jgi:signal transduction histidine kinase/ligand-binding sensor domain-containing protein/DNA-binding response OmpR family regulator
MSQTAVIRLFKILLLFSWSGCFAQESSSLFFSNISTRNGLPSNIISAVAQDNNHFIWVGTGNGLARFDGYEFKTFKRQEIENSLPANEISALLIDGEYLWVGTWRGLCKINTKTFRITRVNLSGNDVVRTLYKDRNGDVWIGTASGLIRYTGNGPEIFTRESHNLSHNTIRSIYEDTDGVLWVGTYDKLNKFDKATDRFVNIDLKGSYKPELKNNLICDIKPVTGHDSLLWIGTETGLIQLDRFTLRVKHFTARSSGFSNEVIKNIYAGPNGQLWLGTDFGLNIFDPQTLSCRQYFHNPQVSYSIPNNVIWEIFEDAGGVVWLVTSNGLSKINKQNHLFSYHEVTHEIGNQVVGNQVKALLVARDESIWVATIHGVLQINANGTRRIFSAESYGNQKILLNNVFALEEDDLGRIWIGTAGGINVWDKKQQTMHAIAANETNGLTSNYIARFIKGADGSFWVSAWEGGLFKVVSDFQSLRNPKFEFIGDFASEKISYAVNALWGIKNNELFRIDHNSYLTKPVKGFNTISRGRDIYNLYYAPQGSIWAGTLNGLIEYRPSVDSAFFHSLITGSDVALSNIISDANGNIWAAVDKFIIKYAPRSNRTQMFPLDNDLPLKTFSNNCVARKGDETILFGGDNGFISFRSDIRPNEYKPRVYITSLEINNRPVQALHEINDGDTLRQDISFTKDLTLNYSQRSISISFASLHYWQPDINVFAYKMDGVDKDWKYVSGKKNYAVYSNLLPGDYTLRIKATNNYGIWSDTEATLNLTVRPPLFLSPLFIALYIILLVIGGLAAFRIYAIRLKLKNEIKLTRIEKEYAEEVIQAKQRFFTSISHELRTPISLIIPPIQQIIKRGNLDEENKSLITLAERNSQRLLRLINQILDFRKLEHEHQSLKLTWFDLVPYAQELYTLFTDKAARNDIDFTFHAKITSCEIWADREKVEIIIFNLLSNAFKFTPKKGSISLSIDIDQPNDPNASAKISVSDSGLGIAQEEQSRIFEQFYQVADAREVEDGSGIGLTLVSEYTKLHKGQIRLQSYKGKGSTFEVLLPLGNDHFPVDQKDEGNEINVVATRSQARETYQFNLKSDKPVVLIVEDNSDMIEFIVLSLKHKYHFLTAENGEDALNKVHGQLPSLVISDIMMPVMDGLDFCKKIKEDSRTSHIPIILLTAKSLTSHKIEGIRMGADIYMTKPFEIELLEAHIDHLLERQTELAQYFRHELITEPIPKESGENEDDRFLKKVMNTIEANISNSDFSVEHLSDELGMSSTHLYRKLKSLTHLSANEIIKRYRLKKASLLLKNKEGNISEIMYEVGFSNLSYFSKCFKTEFSVTPKEFQQRESKTTYSLQDNLDPEKNG